MRTGRNYDHIRTPPGGAGSTAIDLEKALDSKFASNDTVSL